MRQKITKLWIDESGDSGFKFAKGSSSFLILAVVYLTHGDKEANINKAINKLKLKLNLSKGYEFKFSRCKDKFRKKLFQTIKRLPLRYKAIVVDKRRLKPPASSLQPHQLYCEAVRRLLYDNNPPLDKTVIIIDEATARIHRREFNSVLKKYLSKSVVKKIRQARSQSEIGIQIADMIAGSIFRKYEKIDDRYYQIVKEKEKIIMEF